MSVWEERDVLVLRALASSQDPNLRHGFLNVNRDEPNALGLDISAGDLHDSLLALEDAGYVEGEVQYESGMSALFTHLRVTGRGQQALGEWPLFDGIASPETLALLLERLADQAPSCEEEGNLRRAARYARSLSVASLRAALIGALVYLAKGELGLN